MKTNSPLNLIINWVNLSRDPESGEIPGASISEFYEDEVFEFTISRSNGNKIQSQTYSKSLSELNKREKDLLFAEYLNRYENTNKTT